MRLCSLRKALFALGLACSLAVFTTLLTSRHHNLKKELPPEWTGIERRSRFREVIYHERRLNDALIRLEQPLAKSGNWPKHIIQIDFTPKTTVQQKVWNVFFRNDALADDRRDEQEAMETWSSLNPGFQHLVFNASAAQHFVQTEFSAIPDIVQVYNSFPQVILKADMFRYLAAWRLGGVYADKDISCRKPVGNWLPHEVYNHSSVDTVVGIEVDEAFSPDNWEKNELFHWRRGFGIAQYAFMTKPFAASMRQAIIRSVSHAFALSRSHGIDRPDGSHQFTQPDVHTVTGPEMFTDAIIDVVQEGSEEYPVTWRNFSRLTSPWHDEPSRVCVLPINYFGSGQRHSGSEDFDNPDACINHFFLGTWKHSSLF